MEAPVVVVGAGAAGLAAAIFAARRGRGRVVLLDAARRPGAKILVSGGGRCNVTNREVTERDFSGGQPHIVRRVLRALYGRGRGRLSSARSAWPCTRRRAASSSPTRTRPAPCSTRCSWRRSGAAWSCGAATAWTGVERSAEGMASAGDGAAARCRGTSCSRPEGGRCRRRAATAAAMRSPARWATRSCPHAGAGAAGARGSRSTTALAGVAARGRGLGEAPGARRRPLRGALLWTHFGVSGPVVWTCRASGPRALEGSGRVLV